MRSKYVCILAFTLCGPSTALADEPIDYLKSIKPLLETKCYSCHGVLKQEAGLRLDTRPQMIKGGDSGTVLVPHKPDASIIVERVMADEDSRMPPPEDGAALKPDDVELLRRWIEQGARAPEETTLDGPENHWAFQRIERPNSRISPGQNPIDFLLERKQKQAGVVAQPLAPRSLRIRRLYLDLIGLPPTLEQLRDQRPWQDIVDELLTSPQHGERWARHWMDVWRYSDWYGLGAQLRHSQKHMWHWRDWIVNSLNADKPYDRMIHEMLAGDELDPDNHDAIAGTGFLARNYYLFNRTTWLDSTIEHTGKAFLGLTFNCAKCHDHKYDPISHEDYYSLRAIFEPHQVRLDPIAGVTDFEKDGLPRVFDDQPDAQTFLHLRGDPRNPDADTKIGPRVPTLFASFQPKIEPINLPTSAFAPGTRDYVQRDYVAKAERELDAAKKALAEAKRAVSPSAARRSRLSPVSGIPKLKTPAAGERIRVRGKENTKRTQAPSPQPSPPNRTGRSRKAASGGEGATTGKAGGTQDKQKPTVFRDDFDKPNSAVWDIVGDWKYANGKLTRSTATRDAEYIRYRKAIPRDFELSCRYVTTGGATYKSVTFRFDESADRKYANFVYTSAHGPDPKVQVAITRAGTSSYPVGGRVSRPINVGESYELRFAVRDRLVNIWLNDKFQLAYELPDRRPDGSLALSGFDATVEYDWIEIRALPRSVKLTPAKNAKLPSLADPETALQLAEAKLDWAQKNYAAVQAVIAADNAKFKTNPVVDRAPFAARRQAEAALAEAKYDQLAAGANVKKRNAANNALKQAQAKLKAANKGNYTTFRASRKALEGPDHKEQNYAPTYSPTSTGRRLALARWVTSRDNPLTARVAVNHVWMRHFGEPLVESVDDFGLRAKKPVQLELLDTMAVEFIESGWSFRHLHRLIVTCNAYQLTSSTAAADESTTATDPTNKLYWRANTRRMESQVVRDSLLQLAGTLDLRLGGPSLDANKPSNRRSLYFKHSRDQHDKFLSMFDDADLLQCYRRSESIVPQQALALANSKLSMQMAEKIATRWNASDEESFIASAIETILGRAGTDDEIKVCRTFCQELRTLLKSASEQAETRVRTRLIHSLINHNDFIVIR